MTEVPNLQIYFTLPGLTGRTAGGEAGSDAGLREEEEKSDVSAEDPCSGN
jgi:hypothetical protein